MYIYTYVHTHTNQLGVREDISLDCDYGLLKCIQILIGNVKKPTLHATARNRAKLGEVCTVIKF
jgi:hypothetical protein